MALTAQGMFEEMGTQGPVAEGSKPISTMFSGQQQGTGGGGGNAKAAGAAVEKVGEMMGNKGVQEAGKTILKFLFYGGETVNMIKSSPGYKVKITGGPGGIKTPDDKCFYKNVTIPRKKV